MPHIQALVVSAAFILGTWVAIVLLAGRAILSPATGSWTAIFARAWRAISRRPASGA